MEYLLKSSVIILMFYLCYKLFLEQETFFESNRWFLLAGLLGVIIIPFIYIPTYIEYTPTNLINPTIENTLTQTNPKKEITLKNLLVWVHLVGCLILCIKLTLEISSLFNILKQAKKTRKNNYTYITSKVNIPPFSFFRYIVYNPNQFNKNDLKHILNHEKAHAKQLHSLDVLFAHFITILLWWNPFVWLYKKEIKQNLEFIADQKAQRNSICQKSYQMLLVKTSAKNKHQLALANNFYNSLIKKRIVMLHKSKSHKFHAWKYALILPLLAIFLMSFNTKKIYTKNPITQVKPSNNNITNYNKNTTKTDTETHIITKDFTSSDFNNLKTTLEKNDIQAKFKNIKRNAKSEITAIKIELKSTNANANFSISNENPIKAIQITYKSDGSNLTISHIESAKVVFVKKGEDVKFSDNEKNVIIVKADDTKKMKQKIVLENTDDDIKIIELNDDNENNNNNENNIEIIEILENEDQNTATKEKVIIIKNNKDGNWVEKDKDDIVWIDEEGAKVNLTKQKKDTNLFISNNSKNALYLLNDKETSYKEIEKLDPNKIAKVEVLKGEKALKKYGEKAKDGVIIITTK